MARRVVVTGMGLASPIGHDLETIERSLLEDRTGIRVMTAWGDYEALWTRLGGPVENLELSFPRRASRSMGRVAKLAVHSAQKALDAAGLERKSLSSGRVGIAYGSTHGSSSSMEPALRRVFTEHTFEGMESSAYFKYMSHTTAANLAIFFGIQGRVITTCSACTSGSQGIGYGYENIKHGLADVMVCGGAEELHPLHAATFDVMYATSTKYNEAPESSPRPYDAARDGLVVGEGAGTLILEDLEHARARGATIFAEILGYGTNCDGMHATSPSVDGMAGAMLLALQDAGRDAGAIQYVNGHGTATDLGDVAETQATNRVLGSKVPLSSTKSFTGHTLGACGALESIFCIRAMQSGFVPPTRNLEQLDERCAELDYVTAPRKAELSVVMNNNFAFGGVNTSLIFGRAP